MSRELRRLPAGAAYWEEAARLLTATAQGAVRQRGRFAVALSGGETPRRLYQRLAEPPYPVELPWAQTLVFFGDERWVEPNDPRSNVRLAEETLLSRLPVRPTVYPPKTVGLEPPVAAQGYGRLLREVLGEPPVFDLVLLGLGTDGHTASLFPGSPALREEDPVAASFVENLDSYRLTLTPGCLNRARLVLFLVVGSGKAEILRQVYRGRGDPFDRPAQLIDPPAGRTIWLVDAPAAAGIG